MNEKEQELTTTANVVAKDVFNHLSEIYFRSGIKDDLVSMQTAAVQALLDTPNNFDVIDFGRGEFRRKAADGIEARLWLEGVPLRTKFVDEVPLQRGRGMRLNLDVGDRRMTATFRVVRESIDGNYMSVYREITTMRENPCAQMETPVFCARRRSRRKCSDEIDGYAIVIPWDEYGCGWLSACERIDTDAECVCTTAETTPFIGGGICHGISGKGYIYEKIATKDVPFHMLCAIYGAERLLRTSDFDNGSVPMVERRYVHSIWDIRAWESTLKSTWSEKGANGRHIMVLCGAEVEVDYVSAYSGGIVCGLDGGVIISVPLSDGQYAGADVVISKTDGDATLWKFRSGGEAARLMADAVLALNKE